MHHGTCATHVPWCMPGSLTSGFVWSRWRGNVPGIPGACKTHNFPYLVRGPWTICISLSKSHQMGKYYSGVENVSEIQQHWLNCYPVVQFNSRYTHILRPCVIHRSMTPNSLMRLLLQCVWIYSWRSTTVSAVDRPAPGKRFCFEWTSISIGKTQIIWSFVAIKYLVVFYFIQSLIFM